MRRVIDKCIAGGSTVILCALDLWKAFDKMNHHALLIKLMNRQVPINELEMIEKWLDLYCTCIKWDSHVSNFFKLAAGVRQMAPCPLPFYHCYYCHQVEINGTQL